MALKKAFNYWVPSTLRCMKQAKAEFNLDISYQLIPPIFCIMPFVFFLNMSSDFSLTVSICTALLCGTNQQQCFLCMKYFIKYLVFPFAHQQFILKMVLDSQMPSAFQHTVLEHEIYYHGTKKTPVQLYAFTLPCREDLSALKEH